MSNGDYDVKKGALKGGATAIYTAIAAILAKTFNLPEAETIVIVSSLLTIAANYIKQKGWLEW